MNSLIDQRSYFMKNESEIAHKFYNILEKVEEDEEEPRPTIASYKSQSAQRNLESRFKGDSGLPRLL